MNQIQVPSIACYGQGQDFDWWRGKTTGYVGRPPSPFPAPFETPRLHRDDSADLRYVPRATEGCTSGTATDGAGLSNDIDQLTGDARRIYWPLFKGPELPEPEAQNDDLGNTDLNSNNGNGRKKTNPLPYKRPPWCPAKMPNKWGVAGHPPPYTNYCKETLFNTRTADPSKVTIKTTF